MAQDNTRKDQLVREFAADALELVFAYAPDKDQAREDLQRLSR